jgi:hypothetical protein
MESQGALQGAFCFSFAPPQALKFSSVRNFITLWAYFQEFKEY